MVGKFVDRERPDYLELLRAQMKETLGDRYVEPEVTCAANVNGDPHRRIRRPGRDPGRGGDRQSRRHFQDQPRLVTR